MERELRTLLKETRIIGRELRYFEQLDSTNAYARNMAAEGVPDGTVIIADAQTAGRGRMGRAFESAKGKGLYFSVLLRPKLPPEKLLPVTALAGVAACRAVAQVCDVQVGLKWPNDLVINGKKLAGILTELIVVDQQPCLVLGIGINVSQGKEDFTPEVAKIATSLEEETREKVSRPALAAALIEELDALYSALCAEELAEYLTEYRKRCVNIGKVVQVTEADGRKKNVIAVDVDEAFGLVVRGDSGVQTVRSGEVSVRGLYGYVE